MRFDLELTNVKDIKVGFIGLDLVDKGLTPELLSLIKEASSKVDVLMVAPHWGIEYKDKANAVQKDYAKKIVENGADLIVGSHPHWVQDSEYISGKPVYYSLGNFVFDQPWSQQTKKGLAVKFFFKGNKLIKEELMPIYMRNHAQPEWKK